MLAEIERCLSCGHCNDCGTCFVFCPDVAIRWEDGPVIDLEFCKGCGICVTECPGRDPGTRQRREAGRCLSACSSPATTPPPTGRCCPRAEVISAYPITPQTMIVELLSEMTASGTLDATFITVESEHSAMAACVGASAAGARTYTATAGQGLALMHEMLHWAVGARLPVVLTNVSRAMAPGWSIWSDQTDILSQRDVGWMMLFAESVQEAQDFVIWSYRVAEQVYLPAMVGMDAFILSHTAEPLIVHDQAAVDAYLPRFEPIYALDPADPRAYGGLVNRDHYFELRYKIFEAMERAGGLLVEAGEEFGEVLGSPVRPGGGVPARRRRVRDRLRRGAHLQRPPGGARRCGQRGIKVGLLRLVAFRPFPFDADARTLAGRPQGGGARPQHESGSLRDLRRRDPLPRSPDRRTPAGVRLRGRPRWARRPGGDGRSRSLDDLRDRDEPETRPVRRGEGPARSDPIRVHRRRWRDEVRRPRGRVRGSRHPGLPGVRRARCRCAWCSRSSATTPSPWCPACCWSIIDGPWPVHALADPGVPHRLRDRRGGGRRDQGGQGAIRARTPP